MFFVLCMCTSTREIISESDSSRMASVLIMLDSITLTTSSSSSISSSYSCDPSSSSSLHIELITFYIETSFQQYVPIVASRNRKIDRSSINFITNLINLKHLTLIDNLFPNNYLKINYFKITFFHNNTF